MEMKTFDQLVVSDIIWYACGEELLYGTILEENDKTLTILWEDGIRSKLDIWRIGALTKTYHTFTSRKEAVKSILEGRSNSNILRRRKERRVKNDF